MSARAFVDTNILVYAHDHGAGVRHERARKLIELLWRERTGVVSTQVLQELYVNIRRKAARPLSMGEARSLVRDYLAWEVVVNDGASILGALEIEERYELSFWDSLIVQAAHSAGLDTLYSEDLAHDQVYGEVRVVNPLVGA